MKKDYQKPEVELISLAATEAVTNDNMDGNQGDASVPDNFWGN